MSRALDTDRREHRFHMALSADELTTIENFQFDLRIATRAEAARQLMVRGLFVDDMADLLSLADEALSLVIDTLGIDTAETVLLQKGINGSREVTIGEVRGRISEFIASIKEGGAE